MGDVWRPQPKRVRCRRCGHDWIPRVARPRRCCNLRCQSPDWDREPVAVMRDRNRWGCLRCRALWPARYGPASRIQIQVPAGCPRCRTRGTVVELVNGAFPPGARWVPRDPSSCPTCHRPYAGPRGRKK